MKSKSQRHRDTFPRNVSPEPALLGMLAFACAAQPPPRPAESHAAPVPTQDPVSEVPVSSDTSPAAAGSGELKLSVPARWRCDLPGCKDRDWVGNVIGWPPWSAFQNNARSGDRSRSVFDTLGQPLYPYMGSWASGCKLTVESGVVLVIEWKRGADVWRETRLEAGQQHVIELKPPEDGAMIESPDGGSGFAVVLEHCTPKPLDHSNITVSP